jgi:hypothetical protein
MKKAVVRFILISGFLPGLSLAQTDSVSSGMVRQKPERFFSIKDDNDLMVGTDRYYTQGLLVELIMPVIKKSPVSRLLIPLRGNTINYYGLQLEQDIFTPTFILDTVYWNQYPYSGVLFLAHSLWSLNPDKHKLLNTKFDLGLIGPSSFVGLEQDAAHALFDFPRPTGWYYQLSQDIIINYDVHYEKGIIERKHFEMMLNTTARAGTLYDDAGVGAMVSAGKMKNHFQQIYSSDNCSEANKKLWQCYVYAGAKVKTVVYNATLQGGMFDKNSVYVINTEDVKRVVGTGTIGIVISYKRICMEYSQTYITPEYKTGLDHSWGHCSLAISF